MELDKAPVTWTTEWASSLGIAKLTGVISVWILKLPKDAEMVNVEDHKQNMVFCSY